MFTLDEIMAVHESLEEIVVRTPILKATHLDHTGEVFLKCENLQLTGSFKLRGAYNFLQQLSPEEKKKGIIAWSAGNHAQGVAKGAQMLGIPATICIPQSGSVSKIRETRRMGAKVELVEGVFDDCLVRAKEIQVQEDLVAVPPFDDPAIILGQAGVGVEIMQEIPDAELVLVPVGGGGLIAGIAEAIRCLNPNCKIIGVESEGAASMYTSIQNNKLTKLNSVDTIADGIAVKSPGELTYNIVKESVDEIITVSDFEIFEAILHLMEHNHIMVEGAGAAAFAAVKFKKCNLPEKTVCVISGGNMDVELLSKVVRKALVSQKRLVKLKIEIEDKVGVLESIISTIAKYKGNISTVHHDRLNPGLKINSCITRIEYEVQDYQDAVAIEEELRNKGFKFLESSRA